MDGATAMSGPCPGLPPGPATRAMPILYRCGPIRRTVAAAPGIPMTLEKNSRWVLRDLLAGLLAILAVVGVSIRASFVGADLRALFAINGAAFYLAGVARGGERHLRLWLRGLLVSCPGLLGTAALIMNDGLHRWPIPLAVTLSAIAFTTAGLATRGAWREGRGRALGLSALCAAALALEVACVPSLSVRASLHRLERPAAEFAFRRLEGGDVRSADLRGKVVVLAFWASWCLPCRWEMPELEAASRRMQGDSAVVFLAVDAGWGGESLERGRRYLARKGWRLPAVFDSAGMGAAALRVHALPTIVLLDRHGRPRFEHNGFDRSERVGDLLVARARALEGEPGP